MKIVDHVLIMDIDGVITNPREKRITEPEILDHIANKINNGEPVALNTGRSLSWLGERRIISDISERIKDKKNFENLLVIGEKGGTWLTFSEDGTIQHHKDDSISVPQSLQEKVKNLIEAEHSDSMFYDASKETMITVEMKDGYDIGKYKEEQAILEKQLLIFLEQSSLNNQLKIDSTTIAVDVKNSHVGKGFAVKKIIEWIRSKGINPQRYIAFGDSFRSDIPMAQDIYSQGLPVEFVYVGKEDIDASAFPFTIHQTHAKFEKGTLEFLKEHSA